LSSKGKGFSANLLAGLSVEDTCQGNCGKVVCGSSLLIYKCQSMFLQGRYILDSVTILFEIIDYAKVFRQIMFNFQRGF
jgi:hypothetical protein